MFDYIKELCKIAHSEMANKIYEAVRRLSLPSRSCINAWAAKCGFRIPKTKEIALERIKAVNLRVIEN